FRGEFQVEEIPVRLAENIADAEKILDEGQVAVMVDPEMDCLEAYDPLVMVDGRMMKRAPDYAEMPAPLVIGLGPGFRAGDNCHAVIETMRGHTLGRVIWQGEAAPNTGIPDPVMGITEARVIRAPDHGVLEALAKIGDIVQTGVPLAQVGDTIVSAPFDGVVRGLVEEGLQVKKGMKIGDLDPRQDPRYARLISDKSLAIGGGVLEAILSREDLRKKLYAPD
ncbi:MAG: selenium-dependent molybdenum cofactor biosynthesis protein YqeB, partial [Anaerolineales bacterium]